MPGRKSRGSSGRSGSGTTQTVLETGEGGGRDEGTGPPEFAAPSSELSSDFARRFWEMEVDKEAMRHYYVIHEHASRKLHWDLRLERGGVLKSWALPKEPPAVEGVKRLAVETENHPLAYGTFEGEIPKGSYGAGTVRIWDRGRYEPIELEEGKWVFRLKGERLHGKFCLIRLKPRKGGGAEDAGGERGASWLFFRAGV